MNEKTKKNKKKLKYVTIIWEEIPEKITYFVIPRHEITKSDILMLKACHNNWVNSADYDTTNADRGTVKRSLNMISNLIIKPDLEWIDENYRNEQAEWCEISREEFDAVLGKWHGYKLSLDKPLTIPRSRVYRTGFLM